MPIPTPSPARAPVRSAMFRATIMVALLTAPVSAAPPGGGWALAWSDEFEGSSLNGSNWTIGTGGRRDAVNTANAVSVGGGALTIKTYTEGGTHYTGWIGSNGKFENAFGYWEARMRFNSSAGMWSAFWLQSAGINGVGDPAANGTEIDIVEHRRQNSGGGDIRNQSSMNVHWDGYGADHKTAGGALVPNPGVNPASLQGNYHTYGLLWEPGKYTFYIDGTEVWSTTAAISQVRQWIYLTSEVDNAAWAGGIPSGGYGDRNSTSTKVDVDYVRFWQRAEQVINPGFQYRSAPWTSYGQGGWLSTGGRDGSPGLRLNPSTTQGAAFEQDIHGLLPNTPYRLLGWGNVGSTSWPDIRIGVKNHGNPEAYQSISSNGFTQAQVTFTTGSSNNSARVYAWVPTQWGDCRADDIEVRRDSQINNAGFEFGESWPWTNYGNVIFHDWTGLTRSGSHACRLNTSSAARGIEQTVYGLQPSTSYTLSCWVRTDGQPVNLGVKNHGLPQTVTSFTGTGNTWQRVTHTFTTGPGATSATVFAFISGGSNVSVVDLDDFLLGETVPSPWTPADIGATGHQGESAARGSRLVLRGSGDDIFYAADSFHFLHQPIAGDLTLTTRLDSFEAVDARAKAGVMLRVSTAADAAHAMVNWVPEGRVEFIWRATNGGDSGSAWSGNVGSLPWPPHLRLQREGNLVTAAYSTDGSNWQQVDSPQTLALPVTALAGPAVTAHDSGTTATAVFSATSIVVSSTPYEIWAASHGLDPDTNGAPGIDHDLDGDDNLLEFALSSDPNDSASRAVLTTSLAGGGFGLTYDRANAAADLEIIAETSTNLVDWTTSGVTHAPTGNSDADTTEYRATVVVTPGSTKFLRLRVVQP